MCGGTQKICISQLSLVVCTCKYLLESYTKIERERNYVLHMLIKILEERQVWVAPAVSPGLGALEWGCH